MPLKLIFKQSYIYKFLFFMLLVITCLKACSLRVYAYSPGVGYYGPYVNSYKVVENVYNNTTLSSMSEYEYNNDVCSSCFIFVGNPSNPDYNSFVVYLSTKQQFGMNYNVTNLKLVSNNIQRQKLYGFTTLYDMGNNYVVHNGMRYYYRWEAIEMYVNKTIVRYEYTGVPVITDYDLINAIETYLSGCDAYYSDQGGGSFNGNVQVDTTNIENLITSGNTVRQGILDKLDTLNINFDTSGIISYLDRIDKWNLMLFFIMSIYIFRNILHQIGKNVRGR